MITMERQNDAVVEWSPMIRGTDNVVVTGAAVTMSLKVAATGAVVSGATSGVAMTEVPNGGGKYQGVFPASALPSSLSLGELYYVEADATSGSWTAHIKHPVQLVERTQ